MTTFSELNLNPKVLKAVTEAGYETPTPIQAGAIPPALEGRDVLGIAQTGTGKTASFTLPLITMLARGRARARMPRSLVLCPTRELAAQVAENFDTYAKHVKLTKALLIGGVSFKEQDTLIDKGVDVLIATPGRLLDHFERGNLILNDVKVMVVDEADRMLDMGFIPDIERIFGLVPFTRQTLFFSATMASEIERITNTFLSNPAKIEVARQSSTSETIEQRLLSFKPTRRDATAKQKREVLRATIESEGEACSNAIIFCNRKVDVDVVAKSLKAHGLVAEPIHGDLDQSHRTRTLEGFRDGSIRFLVASDVAARGLDIPNVSHVFNYDVPSHAEDYVHRIGRTGRAGRTGIAISIAVPSDDKYLGAIEALIGQPIPRVDAPAGIGADSTPADAAPDADGADEKPKSSRSRTRKRGSRRQDEERAPEPAVAEVTPEVEPAETEPAAAAEPQQQPRTRRAQGERSDGRERSGRGGRGGERGRDRGRDRGPDVVGMGEFLPDFIAMSFDERRGAPARAWVDTDEDDAPEQATETGADMVNDVAEATDAPEAEAAPAPKPRRKRAPRPRKTAAAKVTGDAETEQRESAEPTAPDASMGATAQPAAAEAQADAEAPPKTGTDAG